MNTDSPPLAPSRGKRTVWIALAAVAVVAVIAAWLLWPRTEEPAEPIATVALTPTPTPAASAPVAGVDSANWPACRVAKDITEIPAALWSHPDTTEERWITAYATGREGDAILATSAAASSLDLSLLDASSGAEAWRAELPETVGWTALWAVAPDDEHLVVLIKAQAGGDYALVSLDRTSGAIVDRTEVESTFQNIQTAYDDVFSATTATFDGDLLVLNSDAQVQRLDPADLSTPVWSIDASALIANPASQAASEPILAAGELIFVGDAAHRLTDGSRSAWERTSGTYAEVDEATIHLFSDDAGAHAERIDPTTGASIWQSTGDFAIIAGSQLATVSGDNAEAALLDPSSGEVTSVRLSGSIPGNASAVTASQCEVLPFGDAYFDVRDSGVSITSGVGLVDGLDFTSSFTSDSVVYGFVYPPEQAAVLAGVSRDTGEVLWQFDTGIDSMRENELKQTGGTLLTVRNNEQPPTVSGIG
ncbi:PQQ-binding-like beta-propeller repeat protein [Microbacterium marmarense]|uniref:PQQ-binding-like beta-propeller repeat protein n=1 Tax=Microbacterium marmarense TaxID=3122051 RepID=A0ABU8LR22_9MICO